MLLKELCTTEVACCTRDTTVLEAASIMRQRHVGDLVIVDDPNYELIPTGLLTDRDIVVKVIGGELNARATRVADIMRTPVICASETEDSSVALARMRDHGVRRLPITGDHGKLVGIVTLDDLLRHLRWEVDALTEAVAKEQDQERRQKR